MEKVYYIPIYKGRKPLSGNLYYAEKLEFGRILCMQLCRAHPEAACD